MDKDPGELEFLNVRRRQVDDMSGGYLFSTAAVVVEVASGKAFSLGVSGRDGSLYASLLYFFDDWDERSLG